MADAIDRVQENNLMPFEAMLKDKQTAPPSKTDIVGITKEYWMGKFREMWETEYPKTIDDLSDEHWASWFKNFAPYARQDVEYAFNEVRKQPRDFPPSLSIVYNVLVNRAQSKTRADEFKVKGGCDVLGKTCDFKTEYWMMDKYGKYTFVLLCENSSDNVSCDNYKVSTPTEGSLKGRDKDMTKALWLKTVAGLLRNTDEPIADSGKTQKDRKFETALMAELFADGDDYKETLELFNIPVDLSFNEVCLRISELPKKGNLLDDMEL